MTPIVGDTGKCIKCEEMVHQLFIVSMHEPGGGGVFNLLGLSY